MSVFGTSHVVSQIYLLFCCFHSSFIAVMVDKYQPICHTSLFMGQLAKDCEYFWVIFFVTQLVTIVTHRSMFSL